MDYAKRACAGAMKQLAITPDMDEDSLNREIGLFWNRLFSDISGAMGTDTTEKNIYRVLLSQQKALVPMHQWKIKTAAPPKPKKKKKPYVQIGLLFAAMAVILVIAFLGISRKQALMSQLCLGALALLLLAAIPLLIKKPEPILPPPVAEPFRWNTDAIQQYLTERAAAIDADVIALIPRDNSKPDAVMLVADLLGQIYQGRIPDSQNIQDRLQDYLLRHNIEKIDYSAENAGLFTLLPANGEKTLSPALVKDGQVLCMGTACIKMM